jgi:TRAP transporter TAXI family solute receptor
LARIVALLLTVVSLVAWSDGRAAGLDQQRDLVNQGVVGLISGGITGTYIRIAADLADALDRGYELRVLPVVGKGSVRNIEDLLLLRGIDIAVVQSDVLDFYRRAGILPGIEQKIGYITRLYDEEIHLLTRSEVRRLEDLRDARVNFGTEGSGTFMTAGILFDELGIDVDVTTYPEPEALERLRRGDIQALVFVGGQPLRLVSEVRPEDRLRLLPIAPEGVQGAYVPGELTHDAYPALIPAGQSVPTVAISAVMAAYNWPSGHARYTKVQRFVSAFFDAFEKLKQPPYHPKWQQVDLGAEVPGWQRIAPARALLAASQ